MLNRQQLRREMRAQRHKIPLPTRQQYSDLAAKTLCHHPIFINSQHIAGYIVNDAELDPAPILQSIWQQQKSCYLPVLDPHLDNQLLFVHCAQDDLLTTNRYGIPEPKPTPEKIIAPKNLDLVLMPLVAFDEQGHRLGMGGGYYDRSFAFMQTNGKSQRPYLIGLAFEAQRHEHLPIADWDIPLHGVVTEKHFYAFTKDLL